MFRPPHTPPLWRVGPTTNSSFLKVSSTTTLLMMGSWLGSFSSPLSERPWQFPRFWFCFCCSQDGATHFRVMTPHDLPERLPCCTPVRHSSPRPPFIFALVGCWGLKSLSFVLASWQLGPLKSQRLTRMWLRVDRARDTYWEQDD